MAVSNPIFQITTPCAKDIVGTARPLSDVRFISDDEVVNMVTNTPKPRPHTSGEKLNIVKGIHEQLKDSNILPHLKPEYVRHLQRRCE